MSLIETTNLGKTYRSGEVEVNALQDISLTIESSSIVSVIGPSGSGKTTLLNMMGCLDTPTSGTARVLGADAAGMTSRERTSFRGKNVGFIFQDFNLVPVLTAYENVEYPLIMIHRLSTSERRTRVGEILEAVGIADQTGKYPGQLSGGQKQRVAVARALVTRPRIALADEPTANLDHETAFRIISLMKAMRDEFGTTFIFSTHDPRIVSEAETVYRLEDGRLVDSYVEGKGHD